MKKDDLIDSLNEIDDELLEETDKKRINNKNINKRPKYIRYIAIAASLILIVSIFLNGKSKIKIGDNDYALAVSTYPEDNIFKENDIDKKESYDKYNNGLKDFTNKTMPLILKDSQGENIVYSPINAYIAMSMMTEITGGDSRDEVLNLLEVKDIEELREDIRTIWLSNYSNDKGKTNILNNSIWLRDGYEYNMDTLNILKDIYYVSSYSGDMNDPKYSEALRSWMNESTKGYLEDSIDSINFDADTVISLVSTIYFESDWKEKFEPESTYYEEFTLDSGEKVDVESMGISEDSYIYKGEDFTSTSKELKNGSMLFILPNEGIKVDEILDKDSFKEYIKDPFNSENLENKEMINLRIPKFNISKDTDLIEVFKNLGLEKVFDSSISDFSNLNNNIDKLFINEIKHGAMTQVEESGVLGVAYTYEETDKESEALDEGTYDFILDRPFIYVIYGEKDDPLFIGLVNNPNEK